MTNRPDIGDDEENDTTETCPECNGTGELWDDDTVTDCDLCGGTGEIKGTP